MKIKSLKAIGKNQAFYRASLGAIEVIDEIELNVSSESLDIPVWLYTIATPLFSALIIVRILQRTVEDIQKQNF